MARSKHPIGAQFATLATGSMLAQCVLPLLFAPLLSRLFAPEVFGWLGIYVAIINLLLPFVTWRYEQAIVLPKSDDSAYAIWQGAVLLSIVMSIILALGVYLLRMPIATHFAQAAFADWLWLVPVSLIATALFQVHSAWLNRQQQYRVMSYSVVGQRLANNGSASVLGWLGSNLGLLFGQVVGRCLSAYWLTYIVRQSQSKWCWPRWALLRDLAKHYYKFPLFLAPTSLLNSASVEAPILVLGWVFNDTIVGLYALTSRVLLMPVTVVARNLAQLLLRHAAAEQDSPQAVRAIIYHVCAYAAIIGVPVFLLIAWLGPWLFAWVFGQPWLMAGHYAAWLAPWLLMVFLLTPLSMLIIVQQQQHFGLIFDAILLVVRIAALLLGAWWGQSALWAILCFGFASAVVWAVYGTCLLLQQQLFKLSLAYIWLPLFVSVLVAYGGQMQ